MSSSQPPQTPQPATTNTSEAWAWLWVGGWALLVWGLGTDDLSLNDTSRFLGPLIDWLLPGISDLDRNLLLFSIRKTAHVAEYGALAFLTLRALLIGQRTAESRAALTAFCLAAAFAAADETRQSLSTARTGSAWDVALDSLGAATAIGLLLWARVRLPWFDQRIGLTRPGNAAATQYTDRGTAE